MQLYIGQILPTLFDLCITQNNYNSYKYANKYSKWKKCYKKRYHDIFLFFRLCLRFVIIHRAIPPFINVCFMQSIMVSLLLYFTIWHIVSKSSSRVIYPFAQLHLWQANCKLLNSFVPPLWRGTSWSIVKSLKSIGCPQR